jgi:hypothetical protein
MRRTDSVVMLGVTTMLCQVVTTVAIIDRLRLMPMTRTVTQRQNIGSISPVNGALPARNICKIIRSVRTVWPRVESRLLRWSIIRNESETIPNSRSILPTSSPYATPVTTQNIQRRADGMMTREGRSNIYALAPFRPAGGHACANADGRFSKVFGEMR